MKASEEGKSPKLLVSRILLRVKVNCGKLLMKRIPAFIAFFKNSAFTSESQDLSSSSSMNSQIE
jgi:hypothetical protein